MIQTYIIEKWDDTKHLLGLNAKATEDHVQYVNEYLNNVGVNGVWGTEMDILILRNALNKDIFAISDEDSHLEELILSALYPPDQQPIFISHENRNHFNSIVRRSDNNNNSSNNNNSNYNSNNNSNNKCSSNDNSNNNSSNSNDNSNNKSSNSNGNNNDNNNNNSSNSNGNNNDNSNNNSNSNDNNNSGNSNDTNNNSNNDSSNNEGQMEEIKKQKRKRKETARLMEWRLCEDMMTQFDTSYSKKRRHSEEEQEWIPNRNEVVEELLQDARLELNLNL
jgi:hypothetical protein